MITLYKRNIIEICIIHISRYKERCDIMARSQGSLEYAKDRTRNFATVVYPTKEYYLKVMREQGYNEEEALLYYDGSEGWGEFDEKSIEVIIESHCAVIISPLHYKDINPDGKTKKPHFHILVNFESVKSYETQVKPFFDSFHGVGREKVASNRGYARYLCHLDNPEKAQYNDQYIKCYGGIDYRTLVNLPSDDIQTIKDMLRFIKKYGVCSYSEFMDICLELFPDWFSLIATNKSYIIDKYIKSFAWSQQSVRNSDMFATVDGEKVRRYELKAENGKLFKINYCYMEIDECTGIEEELIFDINSGEKII